MPFMVGFPIQHGDSSFEQCSKPFLVDDWLGMNNYLSYYFIYWGLFQNTIEESLYLMVNPHDSVWGPRVGVKKSEATRNPSCAQVTSPVVWYSSPSSTPWQPPGIRTCLTSPMGSFRPFSKVPWTFFEMCHTVPGSRFQSERCTAN